MWTGLAVAAYSPQLVNLVVAIAKRKVTKSALFRLVFWLIMLPALTIVTLDAIARATYRMTPVGRARALEWTTASMAERERRGMMMLGIPVFAIVVGTAIAYFHPAGMIPALPFLLAWLVAPAIVAPLDRPAATADDGGVTARLVRLCQGLGVVIKETP